MKNMGKLIVISIFALGALFVLVSCGDVSRTGMASLSARVQGTPPVNANAAPANSAVNAANTKANSAPAPAAPATGKTIPKTFALATDSQDSNNGEVAFNHENHAFLKEYSADGKSVMACVECHHTDQPKSSLKPPDVTSERDVVLTFDVWKTSNQKVSQCRDCHFQEGSVPEGKTMPTLNGKPMNNQIAFHLNCNTCHDQAYALRPDLKKTNKSFATSKDCGTCHKPS